jgi:hypothetical protein
VLARRIIAVSPDPAFGDQLATTLQPMGTVELHRGLESLGTGDLDPALFVIHVDGEIAAPAGSTLARLVGDARAIVVLPRPNLAVLVDLMHVSERVAGVMIADGLDPRRLLAMAERILVGDLFGLERLLPGTPVHAEVVGDYQEKSACVARIAELATQLQVPNKYHASIEQCSDEMLMNALYDAPVDEHGAPIFAGVPTKTRILLRTEKTVAVQYTCDGTQFAISTRDAFGSLQRRTMLRVLHKCLHAQHQIDRKAGGAGVGLFLMASAATTVYFNVIPGVATEVICTFDLTAGKPRLEQFGFFEQEVDVTGKLARGRGVKRPAIPGARRGTLAIVAASIIAVVLVGIGAWPRIFGSKKPAVAPIAATVDLDSEPTGATVEIDGKPIGATPLTLTSLPPGADVSVVLKRTGYQDKTAHLKVPGPGDKTHLLERLDASADFVRVHFVSTPSGARVLQLGQALADADRTYTPADVFVVANKPQRFMLTMPNHVPLMIEPFTPSRGGGTLEKGGTLVAGATLRIEAAKPGTVSIEGAPHCENLTVPVDCTLAPGTYNVEYVGADRATETRSVTIAAADTTVKF